MEQVAAGRHDSQTPTAGGPTPYYTDPTARGESPGWWTGTGAAVLVVSGRVKESQMRYLVGQGRHPEAGYQLGQRWRTYAPMTDEYRAAAAERALSLLPDDATVEQRDKAWHDAMTAPERRSVSAFDVTVSPVNSVSLLWAFGDDDVKRDVIAAHQAGVRLVVDHLERHGAFARAGAGGIRQLDTAGLAAMVFDHRMSRARDPQLHAHIVVSAKVKAVTPDGGSQWLALDGRGLYRAAIGARIAYERAVEAELRARRGIVFAARPDSGIREIVGISDASLRHYAKRRTEILTEIGREPATPRTSARRWRARAQDATLRTRRLHKGAESTHDAVRRWHAEDRAAGLDTSQQIRRILTGRPPDDTTTTAQRVLRRARRLAREPDALDETTLHAAAVRLGVPESDRQRVVDAAVRADERLAVARAVDTLGRQRAVFGQDHLELAIGQVLAVRPGHSPDADWLRVKSLAEQAVTEQVAGLRTLAPPSLVHWAPALRRASDRQSEYRRHRDVALTTHAVLAAEKQVLTYARRLSAQAAPREAVDDAARSLELSAEKQAALRFLVGDDRRITGVIGPAGTGKTYLQRAVVAVAHRAGIPVIGLTVGQAAANLLADDTRQPDGRILRTENIARWLHAQHRPPQGTTSRHWRFAPGQWVIVDEASQVSSHDLARVTAQLDPVGGKLILVGDPHQTSAVGPGGLLRHLTTLGATTRLTHTHRFTHAWEGPASLRLRSGDPTVLAEYDHRGRLIGGHRQQLVQHLLTRWLADTTRGVPGLILVDTEAEATDIARQAREMLLRAGRVSTGSSVWLRDGNRASVGDIVVTRRNDRRLGSPGSHVTNRDQWRIDAIATDGLQVTNARTGTTATLPTAYVVRHTHLAYAQTADSAQGQTVHTARALITDSTSLARLYVMLTRGHTLNEAYVVTDDEPREGTPPQPPTARVAVLADIMRRANPARTATETEQQLWADADALHTWMPIYDDLIARARIPEYLAIVRRHVGPILADRLVGDLALPALIHRLTTYAVAGHDPGDVLRRVIRVRELDTAEDIAAVLTWRIDRLLHHAAADPATATAPEQWQSCTARIPADVTGDVGDALRQVATICDRRTAALAELTAHTRPEWSRALGDVPTDDLGRRQWLTRAEVLVTYRDSYRITSDHPLGPEPPGKNIPQWNAWQRARLVLGTATLAGHLTTATDAELTRLVAAQQRADAAAPSYVADELRAAHLDLTAAEHHRHDITHLLTTVDAAKDRLQADAQRRQPRWWQRGPSRTRQLAAQAALRTRTTEAARHATELRRTLSTLDHHMTRYAHRAATLDSQHATWQRWYDSALPTRYAGLAAAAELTRRAATRQSSLTEAVTSTAAKVQAIHDTRPRPHVTPVPAHLDQHTHDAHQRLAVPGTPSGDPELG
ncbi:MobF family relaxase [Micromonospora sp. SH-82]|uniref:MobF family relaxase n=1 Tax=Micromonospora sp. SH-82 TaxID=3132938 RepID=UPI003EC0087A